MADSVLRAANEIYSPFDRRETRRLQTYVDDVEELVSSSLFRSGGQKVELSFLIGEPLKSTYTYPGEEAVRAVVPLFRQLYNRHESTSYNQVLKLLGRHAKERGTSASDIAVSELRALREWEADALQPGVCLRWQHMGPDGSISEEELTPAVLIDLFLHGRYLHKGNAKSDKLDAWPLAHLVQQSFLGAVVNLSQVYWTGANVVREVLRVPALLDAQVAS